MQLVRRRLVPPELDHELIWLTVSFGSLAFAAIWLAFGLPWPRCAFHDVTGLPCVTCGMTRSAIQFFHGNFLPALRWNPLVFVALCGLSIFDAYAFVVQFCGKNFCPCASRNFSRSKLGLSALALAQFLLIQVNRGD
jgi:hypothetical protein